MPSTKVDPRFRQMGRSAKRRRNRVSFLRWGAGAGAVLIAVGLTWHYTDPDLGALIRRDGGDDVLVQVESQFDIAPVVRADTFTDIPGDPLIIPAPDDGQALDVEQRPVPAVLSSNPRLAGMGRTLTVLDSSLMPRGMQLVASLPATREEFALFQAERSRSRLMNAAATPDTPDAPGVIPADQRATSSISFLRDSSLRSGLWRELILETAREVSVQELLEQNGFDEGAAQRLAERIEGQVSLEGPLKRGSILALRYRLRGTSREVIQLSVYGPQGFIGSLAMSGAGQLVPAADAWADQSLLQELLARQNGEGGEAGQQRLLDLIYSVALRNEVRSEIIGEAIAMMARVYDLDSVANENDRLTLILAGENSPDPRAILFIGISGPGGDRPCYVVAAENGEGFECFAPSARVARPAGGVSLSPPVIGVLSQRFVPSGSAEGADDRSRGRVAWSAPSGTPVTAAGDGRITDRRAAGEDGGAMVEITHEGGLVSRYEGLGALSAAGAGAGQVTRGTVIGAVGDGEGDTDAGVSFQLLSDGAAVDPMPYLSGAGEVFASNAVEALIGRIITVESAGNARARNPLSTATGLGQFIESTWLRMMRSYRPDMAATLDRSALLELRFDPDLSRQMVRHLAQENEAYLRARGHAITPGRLYLAHFLGPAGADQALRANGSASVLQVMGPAVVGANPFLRGYSIADLQNWADRKMSGAAPAEHMPAEISIPAEIRAYVEEVDRLLSAQSG
ncbi:peptidoglycan DD-metalloendopeptidase family protein [Paracoccus caeni]|uniref:Peptidoglycan DD-metalloendopeptidase family protein n=1 Tax=Paracoccus caeni TaxID=657651 RepID=A0A934SDJ7_9RHOB|nr:M23 family metallopeptidase [Paracoccus caeni]MBK4214961.1 peptidoglycan DD-metalloendopeptidase family protein [Paracoccus caeni]